MDLLFCKRFQRLVPSLIYAAVVLLLKKEKPDPYRIWFKIRVTPILL